MNLQFEPHVAGHDRFGEEDQVRKAQWVGADVEVLCEHVDGLSCARRVTREAWLKRYTHLFGGQMICFTL